MRERYEKSAKTFFEGGPRMLDEIKAHRYMYHVLKKKVSLLDFEKWIYNHAELEDILGETEYLNFISRNYKHKYAHEDTEKQIRKIINIGQLEEDRIKDLLTSLKESTDRQLDNMATLYDDYCSGYTFLRYIALTYITTSDEYKEILKTNNSKFHEYNEPMKKEAIRLLKFFEENKLQITGEYEYIDNRNEEDRIEIHSIDEMFRRDRDL